VLCVLGLGRDFVVHIRLEDCHMVICYRTCGLVFSCWVDCHRIERVRKNIYFNDSFLEIEACTCVASSNLKFLTSSFAPKRAYYLCRCLQTSIIIEVKIIRNKGKIPKLTTEV